MSSGYALAASIDALRTRARLLAAIREFFRARAVLEVETPALSRAGATDPAIASVTATVRGLGPGIHYLHTSPEFAMKRLLAAGSGDIYQICRVYRDDELGRWHQPEFTMLEWYRVGWDESALMDEVAALVTAALAAAERPARRIVRVRYAEAFSTALGVGPAAARDAIAAALETRGVDVPRNLGHGATVDLAFATVVAPAFAADALTFVHDYPASQAALARLKPGTPSVAARFELFSGGIELANGFNELLDEREQRARFVTERAARAAEGRETPPLDEDLLAALAAGLPACSGVALGIDRLVALALGADALAPALSFVHARPAR